MKKSAFIWQNGNFVNWDEAKTHVLSHSLHYGTAVFEGIRAYETDKGPAIFKAMPHFKRLFDSAKIYGFYLDYTLENLIEATKELILKNKLQSCYIRPLAYMGYGSMGLNPPNQALDIIIAAWEWGSYLGEEGLKSGIRCKMSSWSRLDSTILPPTAKASGQYLNSALAKSEALRCGYDEAIMLNRKGTVAEGPGENLFMVQDNTLITPPVSDNVLKGINAQSIIAIAKKLGIKVEYRSIIRDELFLADELFFTGTAAEVTPIREIDARVIGNGSRGPITETLQAHFFDIVKGQSSLFPEWLTYVSH